MKPHRIHQQDNQGTKAKWPDFPIDRPRPTLLILAGPSGSGKTTFARAIYGDYLPDPIRALLPTRIAAAPSVDIKYPTKILMTSMPDGQKVSPKNGCILHYALNRLGNIPINSIDEDPYLLSFLNTTKSNILIVNVVVDRKRLANQYINRLFFQRQAQKEGRISSIRFKWYKSFDYQKIYEILKYRFSDFVENMYRDWDRIVSEICDDENKRTHLDVRVIGVEPATSPTAATKSFRLLYCVNCTPDDFRSSSSG